MQLSVKPNDYSKKKIISLAIAAIINAPLLLVKLPTNRAELKNSNSSQPHSTGNNRIKSTRKKSGKKMAGQTGHKGGMLELIDDPYEVELIQIDRRTLPQGDYVDAQVERRQVFGIQICRWVIEYQVEVLIDRITGNHYFTEFSDSR